MGSVFGRTVTNIDKVITSGRSIAKSVIQGFTCMEPKQPQDSAPVMAL